MALELWGAINFSLKPFNVLILSPLLSRNTESIVLKELKRLIRVLGIKISSPTIQRELEGHPDYPNLLSISDSLSQWKIDNLSMRATKEQLKELGTPYLVQLKEGRQHYFSVVKQCDDKEIVLSDAITSKWKRISSEEFAEKWTGIITLVEPQEGAGEADYQLNQRKYYLRRLVPSVAIGAVLALWLFELTYLFTITGFSAMMQAVLISLKLFGSYVTGLLLWYEIDRSNAALKKVCTGGKKINCNAILQSVYARPFGIISWSEIGFIYFAGGFIGLLLAQSAHQAIYAFAFLNLLALPYILYSLYYQWKMAGQWCLLCLIVQGIFAAEFLTALIGGVFNHHPLSVFLNVGNLIYSLPFILPALGWFLIKPILLQAKESKKSSRELKRLRYNPEIFESLLLRQKTVVHDPEGLGITLGNSDAKNKIIKVCNPYCGPCAKAHPEIENLLHDNKDLQVQIIFTATNDENDRKGPPVKHLLAIDEKNDKALTRQALDDWYNAPVKDYEAFSDIYKMNGELRLQSAKVEAMSDWCKKTEIEFTPTFFVNGHQLPESYNVRDLNYFLKYNKTGKYIDKL